MMRQKKKKKNAQNRVLLAPRSESLHSSSASIFMLQITSSDRPGMLHGMVDSLWEAELTVHKVQ